MIVHCPLSQHAPAHGLDEQSVVASYASAVHTVSMVLTQLPSSPVQHAWHNPSGSQLVPSPWKLFPAKDADQIDRQVLVPFPTQGLYQVIRNSVPSQLSLDTAQIQAANHVERLGRDPLLPAFGNSVNLVEAVLVFVTDGKAEHVLENSLLI